MVYFKQNGVFVIKNTDQKSCNNQHTVKIKSGNGEDCSLCFAKRVCGGGCPVRNFHTVGQMYVVDPYRCTVTKEIIPYVYKMIDESSGCS